MPILGPISTRCGIPCRACIPIQERVSAVLQTRCRPAGGQREPHGPCESAPKPGVPLRVVEGRSEPRGICSAGSRSYDCRLSVPACGVRGGVSRRSAALLGESWRSCRGRPVGRWRAACGHCGHPLHVLQTLKKEESSSDGRVHDAWDGCDPQAAGRAGRRLVARIGERGGWPR